MFVLIGSNRDVWDEHLWAWDSRDSPRCFAVEDKLECFMCIYTYIFIIYIYIDNIIYIYNIIYIMHFKLP
jgi:hypothetical protein